MLESLPDRGIDPLMESAVAIENLGRSKCRLLLNDPVEQRVPVFLGQESVDYAVRWDWSRCIPHLNPAALPHDRH